LDHNLIIKSKIIKELRKVKVQMQMKKTIKKKSLHLEDDEPIIRNEPTNNYQTFNNDTSQQDVTNYSSKIEEPTEVIDEEQRKKELDDFMS